MTKVTARLSHGPFTNIALTANAIGSPETRISLINIADNSGETSASVRKIYSDDGGKTLIRQILADHRVTDLE